MKKLIVLRVLIGGMIILIVNSCENKKGGDMKGDTGTFTDTRDGQTYKWVEIGDQVWMAENLNFALDDSWCYDNNETHCDHDGRLYTWDAVMNGASSSSANPSGVQGVCPVGWHVPSDDEWEQLKNFVGSTPGAKLKEKREWGNNSNETDEFGFSALPGGFRDTDGSFDVIGVYGHWWSSTKNFSGYAWYRSMFYGHDHVGRSHDHVSRGYYYKAVGFSVRCVRD